MPKDVLIALVGNPLAWLAGLPWGIIASAATALYFGTKWLREVLEWHREAKKAEKENTPPGHYIRK